LAINLTGLEARSFYNNAGIAPAMQLRKPSNWR
jgi:hypothetical protein